jgi:ABC-type bacteriocin/lantibiotic exporter with double-glycine peptidase domain
MSANFYLWMTLGNTIAIVILFFLVTKIMKRMFYEYTRQHEINAVTLETMKKIAEVIEEGIKNQKLQDKARSMFGDINNSNKN